MYAARRKRWLAAVTAALIAVGSQIPAATASAVPTAHASVTLGATPSYSGVVKAWPGDGNQSVSAATTSRDGESCWVMSGTPYNRYVYVDVAPSAIPAGATRALVTARYFDAAPTAIAVQYDGQASRWESSTPVPTAGTGTWRTAQFELPKIRFQNGSNGADFRLNVWAESDAMPPVCFSKIDVTFTDRPLLEVTSPSLVFVQGSGALTFATAAEGVDYQIGDSAGVPLSSGTAPANAAGTATVDVSAYAPGYYTLTATADPGSPVSRTTSFGVIAPTPAGYPQDNDYFNLAMHFGIGQSTGQLNAGFEDALLKTISEVGWGSTRADNFWAQVETSPGVYNFAGNYERALNKAHEYGVKTLILAGYTNNLYDNNRTPASPAAITAFANYAAATSAHYADRTNDIEILNEYNSPGFNNGTCGITAACYIDILKAAYPAIKAANPNANVVGPVTAGISRPWVEDFIALGGLNYIDTFSTHFYGYNRPEVQPEQTDMVGAFPDLVQLIKDNSGSRNIPVWITENGAPTPSTGITEQVQADRLVRAQVLARDGGADKYFWYDALNDGYDETNSEHHYGLFRRYGSGINSVAPKPAAISNAVLIRESAGRTQQAREDLGNASVYSYPLTGAGSDATRVLWSTESAVLRIETATPATVRDQFGRDTELTPVNGAVLLQVGQGAQYLHGNPTAIQVLSTAPAASATATSATGRAVDVTVNAPTGTLPSGAVTLAVGDVQSAFSTGTGARTATVAAAGTSRTGVRQIPVVLEQGGSAFALLGATTTVSPLVSVVARPNTLGTPGNYSHEFVVRVTNNDPGAALAVDGVGWSVGKWSGSLAQAQTVPPGQTGSFVIQVPGASPHVSYPFNAYALVEGTALRARGDLSWSPIEAEGTASNPAISLNSLATWVPINGGTRSGAADVGGTVRFTHTPTALITEAVITDDVHNNPRTNPSLLWQGDSIQYSVYTDFPTALGGNRIEIGAALLPSGPAIYTFAAPPGQQPGATPGADVAVTRDETAKTTTYRLSVPWNSLGFSGPPQDVFGLSFLVNDADSRTGADSRDGFFQWGAGIGSNPKNVTLFRSAQIMP